MGQGGQGGGLGDGGEVVGQAHHAQGVYQRAVGGQVAQAQARRSEGLGHGAGDGQVRVVRPHQLQGAGHARAAELGVGLIDDDDAVAGPGGRADLGSEHGAVAAGGLKDPLDVLQRQGGSGRVVGAGQDDDGRPQLLDRVRCAIHVEGEVLAARSGGVVGQCVAGVLGVHRVGGGEAQAGAPGAAEGLEHVEHDFVGAVGRPDLLRRQVRAGLDREIVRERGPQPGEVPLRVAVESLGGLSHGGGDRLDDRGRGRVGILVDVQSHGDVDLGGPVGGLALQVRSQGQVRVHAWSLRLGPLQRLGRPSGGTAAPRATVAVSCWRRCQCGSLVSMISW